MKDFSGEHLFRVGKAIGDLGGTIEGALMIAVAAGRGAELEGPLTGKWREGVLAYTETVSTELCKFFDLPASLAKCDEIIADLKDDEHGITWRKMEAAVSELAKRIQAEMVAHIFLYVNREQARFYKNPLDGWETVVAAFPQTAFDIEEASKCVAVQRNTAAVFHLMHVHGAGITALGKSLNEPTLDASHNLTWDNVLSRCVKELGEKFSGKSPEWQTDKQFFASATANLLAVKDAWRNPNAHEVGNKYTDEETLDIYNASKTFMRQLAKKLKATD